MKRRSFLKGLAALLPTAAAVRSGVAVSAPAVEGGPLARSRQKEVSSFAPLTPKQKAVWSEGLWKEVRKKSFLSSGIRGKEV